MKPWAVVAFPGAARARWKEKKVFATSCCREDSTKESKTEEHRGKRRSSAGPLRLLWFPYLTSDGTRGIVTNKMTIFVRSICLIEARDCARVYGFGKRNISGWILALV